MLRDIVNLVTHRSHVVQDGSIKFIEVAGSSNATEYLVGTGMRDSVGGTVLVLDKPQQFTGVVNFDYGPENSLMLLGMQANSYSIKGDILSMFDGRKLVDTLHFNNNTGWGVPFQGTMNGLSIEQNGFGVAVSVSWVPNADRMQPGGVGIPLSVHP